MNMPHDFAPFSILARCALGATVLHALLSSGRRKASSVSGEGRSAGFSTGLVQRACTDCGMAALPRCLRRS